MTSDSAVLLMKWINFFFLFYLIVRFAKKPLLSFLDNSSNEIESALLDARKLKIDSYALLKENKENLDKIGEVLSKINEDALKETKINDDLIKLSLEKEIQLINLHHLAEVENLKNELSFSVRESIANIAVEEANKFIIDNITEDDKKRINDDFLSELEKVL